MSSAFIRLRRDRAGEAALEFALVAGFFFSLMLAGMDLGRYYLTRHSLNLVMDNAMRAATVNASLSGCTAPAQAVAANAPFLSTAKLTLCVTQQTASGMTTVTVTASYPFSFLLANWAGKSPTISGTSTASFASN